MRIKLTIPSKKNIVMYSAALLVVLALTVFSFWSPKSLQYDMVFLGDSVVANVGEDGLAMTHYVAERTGKTVFKGAFGGTTMSVKDTEAWGSAAGMEWSMAKLADAICYKDWKSQQATIAYAEAYRGINNQALSYFVETMETLEKIDFDKVETLVIEHGTNDYNRGTALDNPMELYDRSTFGGALRYSLRLLQKTYPKMRIVVMSPTYCVLGDGKQCYNTKYGEGGYLDEYVALEKQIAEEFGVEWIDAYHHSGIREDNASEYLPDNLHLNAAGHKLLGEFLADYFEKK